MKDKTFAVICCMFSLCFAQSNGHLVSAKTVVFMFALFHVFICDFNRDTCLCFWSLVFGIFFTLVHLRPNWGLSLALQCPGKMAREEEVVLWTSDTFRFIVLCHMPLFYMLASLCSLAIFEDQTIGMLRWFKQWYLLFLSWRNQKEPEWKLHASAAFVAVSLAWT